MNISDVFISNLLKIKSKDIPESIYFHAKRSFMDYLGVLLAGTYHYRKMVKNNITSRDNTFLSALTKGYCSHILELDDGHRKGAVHVGAPVFSALLSVAEHEEIDYLNFLYGAIIGYEATIRLACAIQPGNKLRGYHATGTCGTVGAALGIAAALHYDEEQMKTTLSAAVTSAAGTLEMQEDESDLKPLNVGRAAMDAVAAAYIGKVGLKGPSDPIGGRRGFFNIMTNDNKPQYLTTFQANHFCISETYMKMYAACRHAHPAIEAALILRNKINVEKISHIIVESYQLAVTGHEHTDIHGINSAKMSIPFGVACALITGKAGIEAYSSQLVQDSKILSLTQKVQVVINDTLTALCPEKRASIVTIFFEDNTTCSLQIDYPKGEPENPLTQDELKSKFCFLSSLAGINNDCSEIICADIFEDRFQTNKIGQLLKGIQ